MSINIEAAKQAIGIPDFQRTDLLEIALTHPSQIYGTNKNQQQKDQQNLNYRRLAILGDAILGAVVVDYLYDSFDGFNQGNITDIKSQIVRRDKCYEFARKLNLKHICSLGLGEQPRNESEQTQLFGEMFEALIGAIYLEHERDFTFVRKWLVEGFIRQAVSEIVTGNLDKYQQSSESYLQDISSLNADEAAEFLRRKKQEADALVAQDKKLQHLLTWIHNKSSSSSVNPVYKPIKVRAFYLSLIRILGLGFVSNFDSQKTVNKVSQFFLGFNRATDIGLDLAFKYNNNLDSANVLASIFAIDFEPELQQALRELQAEVPNPKKEKEIFDEWRQAQGQYWLNKIKELIGHDLQFSDQQKELLKEYYKANQGILDCLNDDKISPELRQEIEDSLFLPTSEN
ncbi:NACHT C-terminal helical domain 2-containing protein [Cylindrospermum sp. FACHB-282]|uniref:NACHT C-terminal helical domain 2-containing protein n=1 Tax=Cylindrospermum sp. FACHB-282 TaxID=2692794 RepID=UPI001688C3C3|nr:ribonuclease III domain-containing protein [Cylindrospermum sp. FACHB-282]MBD2387063.1 hypothetical protein [Cylindrospermum sp. FACHB-282]